MRYWLLLFFLLFGISVVSAQRGRGYVAQRWEVENGDSIASIVLPPAYVFARPKDMREYWRLVAAVKKVYPMAKTARVKLTQMELDLESIEGKKAQREYIQSVYDEIKSEYTPILKRMTRSEGKVLLKLIDRQTDYTAYEVLREFKGGFVAGFWQGISRLFGHDLKSKYDKEREDRMIEQIIIYYEAGII